MKSLIIKIRTTHFSREFLNSLNFLFFFYLNSITWVKYLVVWWLTIVVVLSVKICSAWIRVSVKPKCQLLIYFTKPRFLFSIKLLTYVKLWKRLCSIFIYLKFFLWPGIACLISARPLLVLSPVDPHLTYLHLTTSLD